MQSETLLTESLQLAQESLCSNGQRILGVAPRRAVLNGPVGNWSFPNANVSSYVWKVVAVADSNNPPTHTIDGTTTDMFQNESESHSANDLPGVGKFLETPLFTLGAGDTVVVAWDEIIYG